MKFPNLVALVAAATVSRTEEAPLLIGQLGFCERDPPLRI